MLNNTYDVSGYRYGILATKNKNVQKLISENANNEAMDWISLIKVMVENNDLILIDFSDVDGLTLKELKDYKIINNDLLLFVMYDKACVNDNNPSHTDEFIIRHTLISTMDIYDENIPIDDMIIDGLSKCMDNQNESIIKRYKCFLQRYKYGTKEKTDEKLFSKKK